MNAILKGDALSRQRDIPENSVHCIVTSPPYFALRDYGTSGVSWPAVRYTPMAGLPPVEIPEMCCELGQEPTPEAFIGHLVAIFRETWRVLRDNGVMWLNMGDSYAAGAKKRSEEQAIAKTTLGGGLQTQCQNLIQKSKIVSGLKPKDLMGIPWRLAFALQADGWYLRQDIIWNKPNPMPESVQDRCTKAHEYIFMFSKSRRYQFNHKAIRELGKNPEDDYRRLMQQKKANKSNPDELKNGLRARGHSRRHAGFNERWDSMTVEEQCSMGANKRSVWTVATKAYAGAHFATFPPELIVPCILAGCPEGGTVLDMFGGSGTTAEVAQSNGRNWLLIEPKPEYIRLIHERMFKAFALFYKPKIS